MALVVDDVDDKDDVPRRAYRYELEKCCQLLETLSTVAKAATVWQSSEMSAKVNIDRQSDRMDGRMDGWMNRWMDGRTDGWMALVMDRSYSTNF